jgi:heme-degrading monooxygenase HmoA
MAKAMVVRVWRTGLDTARAGEYENFARVRSLPMFQRHNGFCGVLFAAAGADRVVITLWRDRAAAAALERSDDYRATVAALEATGFLRPPQTVELLDVHDSYGGLGASGFDH